LQQAKSAAGQLFEGAQDMAFPMTTENLIQKVREELGTLDKKSEQAVATAMKILHRTEASAPPEQTEEKFLSQNITLEEYVALPRPERRQYQDQAKKLNTIWIEDQLRKLSARWMMVIEGHVVLHGPTLDNYPEDDEFLNLCQTTGKYPFVFFSKRVFEIEEQSQAWHKTYEPNDLYPAVSISLSGYNHHLAIAADLDTGAMDCYSDLELLSANGIIKIQLQEFEDTSEHLSRPFTYFTKRIWLELIDDAGTHRKRRATVICVDDWQNSPFVSINANRTFLLGRSILLTLQPRLVLDFAAKCTEVQFSEMTS
jgi:hypothetical protein